jgi:hypothetical protein
VGNFFLTGARLFFGSLEAALFLFSAITGISHITSVLPVISTNHMATIAAQLQNGDTILGQCEISHPSTLRYQHMVNPIDAFMQPGDEPIPTTTSKWMDDKGDQQQQQQQQHTSNLFFTKHVDQPLAAPIRRLYYINEYGQEIYPVPNAKVITQLSTKTTLVYSIGSLFTSIVPSLILRNVGHAIAHSHTLTHKILLLNGSNDRETHGYSALDFILTITAALNESQKTDCRRAFYQTNMAQKQNLCSSSDSGYGSFTNSPPPFPDQLFHPSSPHQFITHLVYLDQGDIPVDVAAIEKIGIRCLRIQGSRCASTGKPIYNDTHLTHTLHSLCT